MRIFLGITSVALWAPLPILAAVCAVDPLAKYTQLGGDPDDEEIHVLADNYEGDFLKSDFFGSVQASQGDLHIFAPRIHYENDFGRITAKENIIIGSPKIAIRGDSGVYTLKDKIAQFNKADYYIVSSRGASKGSAQNAELNGKINKNTFQTATWTTCSREDPAWNLQAENLVLDNNTNRGTAHHVTFRIKGTPVLYLPYFSFPLNKERATGLLTPTISTSGNRGVELSVPFYWNIAPNQDATFTLRPMSRHGIMFSGQYRFLTNRQYGIVETSWLPSDKKRNHKSRWSVRASHDFKINDQWRTRIRYQDVSDIQYQNDFQRGLTLHDNWYIERDFSLYGALSVGDVELRFQSYKRISPAVEEVSKPFSRAPQITYHKRWKDDGFTFDVKSEAVRFYKKDIGEATRLRINSEIGYRIDKPYGYLEPKLSLDATKYNFSPQNNAFRGGGTSRVLPTFSIDGGVVLEREFKTGKTGYVQTIEPRLFYLYTPYHKQDDIPLFDTGERSYSWHWMFARNRFTGGDRIGDANQLTTALTTRLYRRLDGQEMLQLSVGQVQYFSDRKVTLNGERDNQGRSLVFTEGRYQPNRHWQLYGLSFWDPGKKYKSSRSLINIDYNLDDQHYVGVTHSYSFNKYNQVGVGVGWKIGSTWRLFARQDYSLRYRRMINGMLGAEYDDCCWAWRIVGRRYRNTVDSRKLNTAVYFEFIFKGLGNIGNSTAPILSDQLKYFKPLPQERSF